MKRLRRFQAFVIATALVSLPHLRISAQSPSPTARSKQSSTTDWQLEAAVQKQLADHAFVGSSILSSVNKGVVTLTGNVRSEAEKVLASSVLANIDGVKTVLNNLNIVDNTFHPPPTPTIVAQTTEVNGVRHKTLAPGTPLNISLSEPITTKKAQANDLFHATVATNVLSEGYVLIPTGALVTGRVISSQPAGRMSGTAALSLELISILLPPATPNHETTIRTLPLSSKSSSRGNNTAAKTGGGAAVGAIIGALAGGGTGAAIGAASGGALGAGSNAITHGKDIELKSEHLMQFHTATSLDITIVVQNGRQVLPTSTTTQLEERTSQPVPGPHQ